MTKVLTHILNPKKYNHYEKVFVFLLACISFFSATAQFVAKMEVKEPIKGLCNPQDVYVVFPMNKNQKEAVCPVSNKEIMSRLDTAVTYLKDSVGYEDKGMLNLIINCKGEVVKCEMDNKTKNPTLDAQIVAVFNSLGKWKPAKMNGDAINTSRLWSFTITKGKIIIE